MHRRRFLASASVGTIGVGAGCLSGSEDPTSNDGSQPENGTDTDSKTESELSSIEADGVELRLEETELAIEIESEEGEIYEPEEGHIWVLASVKTTNISDETRDLPYQANFDLVADGSQYGVAELDSFSEVVLSEPVSGEFYSSVSDAREDVSAEGWLIYEVPESVESATLSWAGGGQYQDGEGNAEWEISIDSDQLPDVGFSNLSLPDRVSVGDEIEVEVAFQNGGGSEYELETPLEIEYPDGSTESETIELTVPANDEASETLSYSSTALGAFTAILEEFDTSESTDVTAASATFGEPIAVDGLPEITISEPTFDNSFEYEDYGGETGQESTDELYAFFECELTNSSADSLPTPSEDDMVLVVDEDEYQANASSIAIPNGYLEPVEGEVLSIYSDLDAGETASGVLRYEVPAGTSEADIELIATWSLGFTDGDTAIHWFA